MTAPTPNGRERAGWWKRINAPLSDFGANVVGSLGILGFGLTGFVDAADGLSFSKLKAWSVVVGLGSLLVLLAMKWWGVRADKNPRK